MTVVENTDERFVLRKKPTGMVMFLAPFVLGLAAVALATVRLAIDGGPAGDWPGVALAWVVMLGMTLGIAGGQCVITLSLDRLSRTATYRRAGMFGATERAFPLSDLLRAEVARGTDNEGEPTYRLALRLRDGETLPFMRSVEGWKDDKQSAADAINQFLGVAVESDSPAEAHA